MTNSDREEIDILMARRDPSRVFSSPTELANDDRVPDLIKLELLELWEGQADHRDADDQKNQLADVKRAIESVNQRMS